jgi:hypothetical protein
MPIQDLAPNCLMWTHISITPDDSANPLNISHIRYPSRLHPHPIHGPKTLRLKHNHVIVVSHAIKIDEHAVWIAGPCIAREVEDSLLSDPCDYLLESDGVRCGEYDGFARVTIGVVGVEERAVYGELLLGNIERDWSRADENGDELDLRRPGDYWTSGLLMTSEPRIAVNHLLRVGDCWMNSLVRVSKGWLAGAMSTIMA